jgi:arylsulfatase
MSKTEQMEVLIAVYLFEDLGKKDYDAVMDLVEADEIQVQGVVLASKDEDGEMKVIEAGDHAVRKGATMLGGAGLVVGLFAPPLLAATAVGAGVGAVAGKFAKHRLESGIAEKMDAALPNGSGGVIAVYDSGGADAVDKALSNAVKKSVAQIDGTSAKELKAGLAEAQSGMGGN